MLGYIYEEDLRGCEVKRLCSEANYEVIDDKAEIIKADFLYLGLKGKDFENSQFKQGSRVYTLTYNEALEAVCIEQNCHYYYLYDDFELIQNNTYLTTEALIGYMITSNDHCLYDSNILIIGYGNCGKDMAKKLKALQAKVTISNRGYSHKKNVIKNGYRYLPLEGLSLAHYEYIINTVPFPVITKDMLQTRKETAWIYDVASSPYGIDSQERIDKYSILSSLPSKYAYKSAAKLIYKAIMKKEDQYVKR